MTFLAPQFPRLHFGTDVLVLPQRNAILVAKQAATLSVLSEGRFILGIGAGWSEDEFRLLGANFDQRGAHTDEAIAMMRKLWAENPTEFEGAFYHLEDAWFYPKPEEEGPPIWIGGSSPAALRRAVRFGDAWIPFWGDWESFVSDQSTFQQQVQQLQEAADGRHIHIAANVPLRIESKSDEFATDTARPAAQIISGVQAYLEAGLETIIWNIQSNELGDYIEQMELAAEKIIPAIQDD